MRLVSAARGVAPAAGLFLLLAVAPGALANSAPVVSNVQAAQIAGTGQVRITYDVSDADGDAVYVWVTCSTDNGVTFDLLPVTVSGDVNVIMSPGTGKEIIWNAAADYPGRYFAQAVAKITVSDGPASGGEMLYVPAGTFTMGSSSPTPPSTDGEIPEHPVTLSAFWIDKYEVTNAEFKSFMDGGGYVTQALWSPAGWVARQAGGWTQPMFWGVDTHRSGPTWPGFPVTGVSWYEAEACAAFMGKRLPTEAEWEYAARGTDGREYPWGNSIDGSRANYSDSGDPYENPEPWPSWLAELTPVGFYDGRLHPNPPFQTIDSPSAFGAYDMGGNVEEWVHDWLGPYSSGPAANPQGPASGLNGYRVLRGGSWYTVDAVYGSRFLRSARRSGNRPEGRGYTIGFRCVRTAP